MLNHISLLCIIYGLTILLPNNIVAKTLRAKTLQATKPALRAKQPTVFISMKSVIQQVIKNSMEYKKIIAEQNTTSMPLLQAEMPFDWRLKSTVKQDNLEHNSWGVSSGIQKQFITGTQLELKNDYLNSIKSSQTDVQNLFTLTIQQDLLQNWMGQKNQYQLEKANILSQRSQIQLTEQTEQLIIQSVQQFWKTCLNQLNS